MLVKFIDAHRQFFLKILNLLPESFQNKIKIFYRKYILHSIYKKVGNQEKSSVSFENGKYIISKLSSSQLLNGVNLIGFPTGEFGLGQHIRNVADALKAAKIPYSFYDCSYLFMGNYDDDSQSSKISKELPYKTNIFVCNGDAIAKLYLEAGKKIFPGKYNIHYGAWELRDYPVEWMSTLAIFDEYWAMSSFLQKSVSDVAMIPVIHMPYPIDFKIPKGYSRSDFNLPEDKFLYIFTFDMSSIMARKNPKAVIEAFYKAFPKKKEVGLVIKVVRNKNYPALKEELDEMMKKLSDDKRIYLIDEVLPRDKLLGLINLCDVYVSLHRAEGLGIGMAEAMKMSKAVIATNYSGNTDFTLSDNSCLVDYKLVMLKPLEYIYETGKYWAEPSVDQASDYMKKLYEDKAYYNKISKAGKKYIDEYYSIDTIQKKYVSRLKLLALV